MHRRSPRTRSPIPRAAIIGLVLALLCACDHRAAARDVGGEPLWFDAAKDRLKVQVYPGKNLSANPTLVVVLHGDLLDPKDSYHYTFARQFAAQSFDVVTAAVIRPGYQDELGDRSGGDKLLATGDNYTAEVVDEITALVKFLRERYHARYVTLVGHSGGAAIAALILGRHTDVANSAILVACPCDLPAWRAHMNTMRPSPVWTRPHQGLSPLAFVDSVAPSTLIDILVGTDDRVAPPEYSERYARALTARGILTHVTLLAGVDHRSLLRPEVMGTTAAHAIGPPPRPVRSK